MEYERLVTVATDVVDNVWIGWVLPPDTQLAASSDVAIPRDARDVVKRLGAGLDAPVLAPLRFSGLLAVNQLLDVLAHGNLAAALVMAPGGGQQLPDPIAAAVVHVAAAGATAVVLAHLSPEAAVGIELTDLATEIANAASAIHGLPLGPPSVTLRRAKSRKALAFDVEADIERMPSAQATTNAAAAYFIEAADHLAEVAALNRRGTDDSGGNLAWAVFQLSWAQMLVFKGAVTGLLGRALLPPAARALLEDGARWEWVRRQAIVQPSGNAVRSIVADGKRHIMRVRNSLVRVGISSAATDKLLGTKLHLVEPGQGVYQLPPLSDLLSAAYPTASGADSVRPMYSWLSQFVHATPLSTLHVQRDIFPSVTAPTFAVAVEAACRGFARIAQTTLVIACTTSPELDEAFEAIADALAVVIFDATHWHVLG